MESFVTRPDIAAPKVDVVPGAAQGLNAASGFWLLAPYMPRVETNTLAPNTPLARDHIQAGPYIYDTQGNLVWSGSVVSRGENTLDFRQSKLGNFTLLLMSYIDGTMHFNGTPVVLNSSLQASHPVHVPQAKDTLIDPHEFQLTEDDSYLVQLMSPAKLSGAEKQVLTGGFLEVDRVSGGTVFQWSSAGHVAMNESVIDEVSSEEPLDYLHINSIDKSPDGDYLISGRHTNTIYLISGTDGSVLWRLGGNHSSYHLQGFNFSAQHDARFLYSAEPNMTLLSFLDNGTNGKQQTSTTSSAVVVALNRTSMQADLVRRQWRPDGQASERRGNVQVFPSNHMFVCWSDSGYMTEFDASGDLLLEARFSNPQLASYRAYKLESASWTTPRYEMPVLQTLQQAGNPTASFFASWNGAYNVARWDLVGCSGTSTSEDACDGPTSKLVAFEKTGFESSVNITLPLGVQEVFAYAVGASGEIIGRTAPLIVDRGNHYGPLHAAHWYADLGDEMLAIALTAFTLATIAMGLFELVLSRDRARYST